MKNKKLLTKILACTMLLNSFVPCFAEKSNNLVKNRGVKTSNSTVKKDDKKSKIITDKHKNIQKNDGNSVINWMKNHKILTAVLGIGAFIDGKNMINWELKPYDLKSLYEKEGFFNIKFSNYTKKQEGITWCALACLQGLLKYKSIEISQKDIYKGAFGNIWYTPFFEVHREKGGLSLFSDVNDCADTSMDLIYGENGLRPGEYSEEQLEYIKKNDEFFKVIEFMTNSFVLCHDKVSAYVEKATKNKYTYKVGFITVDNKNKEDFKKHIVEQMKELFTEQKIFSILDSLAYSRGRQAHFVNVVGVDGNNVTIEEPTSGYSYTRTLDGFAEGLSEIANRNKDIKDKLLRKKGVMFAYLEEKNK